MSLEGRIGGYRIPGIESLSVAVSQLTLRRSYFLDLNQSFTDLERYRSQFPGLTMEIIPTRFDRSPKEKYKPYVCGIHGSLEPDFRSAWDQIVGGIPKSAKDRIISAGVLLGIGTETGPFHFLYQGDGMAVDLDVYYNLHPDVLKFIETTKLPILIKNNVQVHIENGWFDPLFELSADPNALKDFKEKYGIGGTLDTAHAIQAALASDQRVEIYLRTLAEKMDPTVIHFSDRGERGDGYPINFGKHTGELTEFRQEVKNRLQKNPDRKVIVVFEVEHFKVHPQGQEGVVKDGIDFWAK